MKNSFLLWVVAAMFGITACSVPQKISYSYTGKLVAAFCAYYVVEIINPDVFEEGMEWRDAKGTIYRNAFTVANFCDFSKEGVKIGDTFQYRIITDSLKNDCIVCLGYMETPSLRKQLQVVRQ